MEGMKRGIGGAMTEQMYHYTESGLDNVYLADGYEFVEAPGGQEVRITDIDGLHEAIGRTLIADKKNLSGKEIRFLRHEMLLSQARLAKLLEVGEQTVHRWEKGKAEIPKPAETLIRLLYREHIKDKAAPKIRHCLERIADLEDTIDRNRISLRKSNKGWLSSLTLEAA
jgi:DNA-binding transcriptional regulator YiaG